MTRNNLESLIHLQTGIKKKEVGVVLHAFMKNIKNIVGTGETIELRGFGVFKVVHRKQKVGRVVRPGCKNSGTVITIPARDVPKFTPSKFFTIQHDSTNSANIRRIKERKEV